MLVLCSARDRASMHPCSGSTTLQTTSPHSFGSNSLSIDVASSSIHLGGRPLYQGRACPAAIGCQCTRSQAGDSCGFLYSDTQ